MTKKPPRRRCLHHYYHQHHPCCRNLSITGEGDFSKGSWVAVSASSAAATTAFFCCKRELILLLRLRGVIGLLEADGIFSRTSLGSLKKEIERDRVRLDVISFARSENKAPLRCSHHDVSKPSSSTSIYYGSQKISLVQLKLEGSLVPHSKDTQSAEPLGELVQWHQRLLQHAFVRQGCWLLLNPLVGLDTRRTSSAMYSEAILPRDGYKVCPSGDCSTGESGVRLGRGRVRINARVDSKRGYGEIAAILSLRATWTRKVSLGQMLYLAAGVASGR